MTSPHHIEFWARGGRSDLPNLLPLCYHHHRLVHEGGWQVIRAGDGVKFIAPERVFTGGAVGANTPPKKPFDKWCPRRESNPRP